MLGCGPDGLNAGIGSLIGFGSEGQIADMGSIDGSNLTYHFDLHSWILCFVILF